MISSLYLASIPFVVILFTATGLFYIFKKPIITLYIMTFTFFFKNFFIYIGTSFDTWKLLSVGFLFIYFFRWMYKYIHGSKNIYETIYIFLVLYVLLMTIVNHFLLYGIDINAMKGGFFKNEGRIFTQIIFFVISINLIFIPFYVIKSHFEIHKILQLIVKACIILATLGMFQYFYVQFLGGENPFPIQASDGKSHSGYILDLMFRINSIAGEPKHMGIAMALGTIMLLLAKVNNLKLVRYDSLWIVLFIINLFLTFSTTGYVLVLVGILIILFLKGILNFKSVAIISIIVSLVFLIITNVPEDVYFIFEKQASKASLEVQDDAVKSYIVEEEPIHAIIGTGLGNIHHYAVKYLPPEFPLFKDTPFKGNTGILILVADYGLIGILLLYVTTFLLIKKNLAYIKKKNMPSYPEEVVAIYFTLILSFIFLLRYYELFFLFIGVMLSLNKILKERSCI